MYSFQKNSLLLTIVLVLSSLAMAQSADSDSDASSNTTASCAPPTYRCARSVAIRQRTT